ncbi:MAG: sporulation protein YqfD [Clostridia bacterium]
MNLEEGIKKISGTIEVEITGFFTERYINLCKINNINIWNIKTIGSGIVRFDIAINDFKKLRKITKKTKCKVKILNKRGVYFKLFKYRKRRLVLLLIAVFIILCILSTSFIWNIEVVGNTYIPTEEIYIALEESGLSVGKNKLGIKTKKVINNLRVIVPDIAWVGIDIEGTNAYVNVVEKTKLPESARNENTIGDIISDKSGIIEKIVAENGTPILSAGEYVEEGRILIEGKTYSDTLETKDVTAKGIVTLNTEYEYKADYCYTIQEKLYTGKTKYTIGVDINNKENYINYLDKSLKYDIIKNSSDINIFGNKIAFCLYKFNLYNLVDKQITKEEILQKAQKDADEYINGKVLTNIKNGRINGSEVIIDYEDEEKISLRVVYHITEEVGYFRERN